MRRAVILGAVLLSGAASPAAALDLRVTVSGIAHAEGEVRVALYDDADSFRDEPSARALITGPAEPGEVTVVFDGLDAGTYALIVTHDENGNGRMDRFLGMIPTEGYGLSNDPSVTGPPAFSDSAFEVGTDMAVTVPLHY